ncbi:hypothetical protein ACWPKO_06550 [Coraliomargarita sp. W4R53]
MNSADTPNTSPRPLAWWLVLSIGILLGVLTCWTWQKWDRAWIERSEGFFPPEWQNEDLETLAWKYPIYRSNDTYQWVHVADALADGNTKPLHHRWDEGLPEGRPNRWHSGLAFLLQAGGSLVATVQDWPTQRGIHHLAHWLGSAIHISTILLAAYLISHLAGKRAALLFAGLFFFNAAIRWDFAFSRLDHEAIFQFCFLFNLLGLSGLCSQPGKQRNYWALLAGVSAGFCWWISATTMTALTVLTTLGLATECFRARKIAPVEMSKAILLWGGSASGMICLLCLCDGRLSLNPSIATIHPIFILVQIGTTLFCFAILASNKGKQALTFGLSLLFGLSPLVWLCLYQVDAHPWLDPMMRRLHDNIVEFKSPFSNGLWSQAESLQAAAIALLALFTLRPSAQPRSSLFGILLLGLLALATLQTRWLGLLATASTLAFCLQIKREQMPALWYLSLGLLLLCFGTWAHQWNTLEKNPGKIFITDLMLQVGARDINLNLQRLSEGETIHVAMPYAFAATSALFPEIHPIGTFYWENKAGIASASDFFAGIETDTPIDYALVQGGRQGAPFAKLATWVARADRSPATIESSLAWRLSTTRSLHGWIEQPYYGTFATEQFSVRIFKSDPAPTQLNP